MGGAGKGCRCELRRLGASRSRSRTLSNLTLRGIVRQPQQIVYATQDRIRGRPADRIEAIARVVGVRQRHEVELLALDSLLGVAGSRKVKAGPIDCAARGHKCSIARRRAGAPSYPAA
jgi:hypothetical protein